MKIKTTILALMMLTGIFTVNAQITWNCGSFTCSVPDTNVVCSTNSTCILNCTITNLNCCSSINVTQVIDSIITLPIGWSVTMCNPNGCFGTMTTSNTFIIAGGSSVTAKFEIHAGANAGNADVRVKFLDAANSSNGTPFHIVGNGATGIADNGSITTVSSQNYPNPFIGVTVIKYSSKQITATKLIITDLQGKTVNEYSLNNSSDEITLTETFAPGTYFYSIYAGDELLSRNKMIAQ